MSSRSHRRRLAPVASLALLVVALAATAASATTPGRNGRISYTGQPHGSSDVWSVLSDNASEIQLTTTHTDRSPSWSPDGTKIAFASTRATSAGDIYVMNADGSNETPVIASTDQEIKPAWSPDGSKIAYSRAVSSLFQIWVANADGSNPTALPTGTSNSYGESWSPDGTHLVYSHDGPPKGLWTMNADGTGQTQILTVPSGDYFSPSYSPDGTKIVCQCGPTNDIATINADGSGLTPLTSDHTSSGPVWSPDGTQIAWVDSNNIWVMNADGTNKTQLTTNLTGSTGGLSWQTLPNAPAATTGAASGLTVSAASLAGTVNPSTRAYGTTYHFEYGTTTAYGSSTPTGSLSGDTSDHAVSAALSGLAAGTTYHYRLVATNGAGTTNGADQTFTTTAAPVVVTPVTTTPAPVLSVPSISGLTTGVRCARRVVVTDPVAGHTGEWFKYALSADAHVTYALQRQVGSRAFRRCPGAASASALRFRRIWHTTLAQTAGRQEITIGTVGFHAKSRSVAATEASAAKVRLSPGLYRIVLVARNAAGASAPSYAYFRVLRAVAPRRRPR